MPGHLIPQVWHHAPQIHAPAKYKRACRYEAFLPDPLHRIAPSMSAEVGGLVSEAEHAVRALNDAARPALVPLARLLLRTEAIASSKIEGMQVGVRELARAEARMETGGKVGSSAREVLANISAMEVAVAEAASAAPFTVDDIRTVHRRLMEGSETPRIVGRLRTDQNWIGGNDYNPCGADFVPPPPTEVDALLTELCQAVNADVLAPLVQAALVHAQFETIHPFEDGNGRTGRALIHVVLRRRGLAPSYVPPISVVLARGRARYISGLTSFRGEDVTNWIEYFAAATTEAARLAKAYVDAVHARTAQWTAQLAAAPDAPRADAAAWAVIAVLPAHPMITAPVAAAATGRAKAAIYQALKQLEGAEILLPLSTGKRNQSWEATGLLDLLMALESGELPG